ncbi:hypothetical protein [Haloarcula sp. JP-L23]|uniref:hypothetical protein n=1 Tax=Haloarcula sp. JP-L23 TaxID=2716717 RepID=UPI00140EF862|nr:hypothetical protein G9465_12360 [Haloarcula sp. JP-L23]
MSQIPPENAESQAIGEQILPEKADSQAQIREQLRTLTEPHTTSCQALGDPSAQNHNDGEDIHKRFGKKPLHRYLHDAEGVPMSIAQHPEAFVDALVYTDERDLELLRALAGKVDYHPDNSRLSHEALERYPPYRAKVFEWIADKPSRVNRIGAVKGTDMFIHGEPGGGKTTLALSMVMWRMQVNNETCIWAESVDESGTNERTEWLALAPYATLAIPEGMNTRVRIVPEAHGVDEFEVTPEDIARDVIRYESVQDLMSQLLPGQFYVVFPDPLHRGCRDVSKFNFFDYRMTTPVDEDGPTKPTDADHWWFAFVAHRITGDVFVHPTFVNLDEAGNILDADAEKDAHEHYDKIKWFRNKYADARKKGLSFSYQAHALSEVHRFARQKIRWRLTMNGNSPPLGRTLPGDRSCPLNEDLTSDMDTGEGMPWKAPNFAKLKWPNMKGDARLDAEVSIDFLNWQEAVGSV